MSHIIEAQKIGSKAAKIVCTQPGVLKIHSIFQHAVNFVNKEDYLVTVLESSSGCSSQAITVNPSDLTDLISNLIITKEYIDITSLIDFEKAEIIYFKLPEAIDNSHYDSIAVKIKLFAECLIENGNLSGFTASIVGGRTIYEKYIKECLHILKYAYINHNKSQMAAGLRRFVGLGQGLTPSGDDFICGFISALYYCPDLTGLDKTWIREMGLKVLEDAKNNTTLISYNMLRCCMNGELSEHMQDLLKSLLTCNDENLESDINKIIQIGSTSGSDTACGILFAFNLIDKAWGFCLFKGDKNDKQTSY